MSEFDCLKDSKSCTHLKIHYTQYVQIVTCQVFVAVWIIFFYYVSNVYASVQIYTYYLYNYISFTCTICFGNHVIYYLDANNCYVELAGLKAVYNSTFLEPLIRRLLSSSQCFLTNRPVEKLGTLHICMSIKKQTFYVFKVE